MGPRHGSAYAQYARFRRVCAAHGHGAMARVVGHTGVCAWLSWQGLGEAGCVMAWRGWWASRYLLRMASTARLAWVGEGKAASNLARALRRSMRGNAASPIWGLA